MTKAMPSEDIKVAKQVLREALATPFGVFDGDEVAEAIRALLAHMDKLEADNESFQAEEGATDILYRDEHHKRMAAEARVSALEEALQCCRSQFGFYTEQHMAKSPPDEAKAKTNSDFVDMCTTALTGQENGSANPVTKELHAHYGRIGSTVASPTLQEHYLGLSEAFGIMADESSLNPPIDPSALLQRVAKDAVHAWQLSDCDPDAPIHDVMRRLQAVLSSTRSFQDTDLSSPAPVKPTATQAPDPTALPVPEYRYQQEYTSDGSAVYRPVKEEVKPVAEEWVLVPRCATFEMVDSARGLLMYFNAMQGGKMTLGEHAEAGAYLFRTVLRIHERATNHFPKAEQADLIYRAMLTAAPIPEGEER
jgi:hypothetical protein